MKPKNLKHKFKAKPTEYNGKRYDSKLEARYAAKLDLAKQAGDLLMVLRQVPFELPGGVKYRCDFMEFWSDGEVKIVDCKGYMTPQSAAKIKMVEDLYPISVTIVQQA